MNQETESSAVESAEQEEKGFVVFNRTDGIYASPDVFPTLGEAQDFVDKFPLRFTAQGYYLTASRERIDPADVELQIFPTSDLP